MLEENQRPANGQEEDGQMPDGPRSKKEMIDQAIELGHMAKEPDGQLRVTEKGQHVAIKAAGGQDIHNMTSALVRKIAQEGCMGINPGSIPDSILESYWFFAVLQVAVRAIGARVRAENPRLWQKIVEEHEDAYLHDKFFERNPHAFRVEEASE